jgi:hypothetical protein
MNWLKLDEERRIMILKALLLTTAGSLVTMLISFGYMDQQYQKLIRTAQLNHKMLMRFVDLSDTSISDQIMSEFEFDSIVKDLKLKGPGKKKS